ncbi:hypothetical protein PENNAL_c0014G00735 [Penicillium nalgiovense]|uniref:DUF7770 domain-containing protein n=1 Tax=Penicillium nalgiovense TaxID=60175 RepID=A0A1V6YPT7_PENNA|nr:hypothetical protein PENNAL_c0014G00735 [Penicillium nalgiovense]CAG8218977.1 unnamed protein product [Penicillium nalgiovense]
MPRSLRSGNIYASPLPPPPRAIRPPAQNAIRNRDYELIGSMNIPMGLSRKKVSECHLEFLDIGPKDPEWYKDPERKNHCIFRLTFLHPLEDDTPYAPIGTRGVLLDLEGVDQQQDSCTAELIMSTFGYEGPHQRSMRVVKLRMGGERTVGDAVRIIRDTGLMPCRFDTPNEHLFGCRDFVSQLIYQLSRNKFLRLPADANTTIYDSFNYRYDMDDDPAIGYVPTPVGYAIFRASYQYTAINGINYHGTRRFLDGQ